MHLDIYAFSFHFLSSCSISCFPVQQQFPAPLILDTSNWVKQMYDRDGIAGDKIEVLPVGCHTGSFVPHASNVPNTLSVQRQLGVSPDEIMILTVGGDAAPKGWKHLIVFKKIIIPKALSIIAFKRYFYLFNSLFIWTLIRYKHLHFEMRELLGGDWLLDTT